jgi:hypothetical protein
MSELAGGSALAGPAARHRAALREAIIGRLRDWPARNPPGGVARVILFGSLARGDFDGASDADLLVIGDGTLPDSAVITAAGRDCDMLARTPAQWRDAITHGHPMAGEIMKDGVEVWPEPGAMPFR